MKTNNKGFSLVELIVVIAIMAILAAVAVVSFSVYIDRAHDAADQDYINSVLYRVKLFSLEHGVDIYQVVIPSVVDDKDDIKLVIGWDDAGNPNYYTDPKKDEIYGTVGDYTMQGDYNSDISVPMDPLGPSVPGTGSGGLDHTHDLVEKSKEPSTCVKKGTVIYGCQDSACDYEYTEQLALGDHRGETEAPEVDGYKIWQCPDCGQIVIKSTAGNAVVPIQ